MNKDLEKQIEEAANLTSSPSAFMLGFDYGKPFWQQGMYTEEEVKFYCTRFAHQLRLHECHTNDDTCKLFDKWFIKNRK